MAKRRPLGEGPNRQSSAPEADHRNITRRRFLQGSGVLASGAAVVPILLSGAAVQAATDQPECSEWRQPTDADFGAIVGKDKAEFLDRVLDVIENEIVPKTMRGVRGGSKLFGGAVLKKSDLSTVVAATNTEAANPLLHGEITTINAFYDIPKHLRPAAKDAIFITTHEPCPLCLAGITWGGFDNFFYLFTYEDSKDAYGIPHDLKIHDEVFRNPEGTYSKKNFYWSPWSLRDLIASLPPKQRAGFNKRVDALKQTYAEMSDIYQKAKAAGKGADVPLK